MSDDDPFQDQDWLDYAAHVRDEMVPKMEGSAIVMQLVPDGDTDVKFAVELGFSIMLDKPIIAIIRPGTKVPSKLARIADEIVELDIENMADGTDKRLMAAVDRVTKKIEKREKWRGDQ